MSAIATPCRAMNWGGPADRSYGVLVSARRPHRASTYFLAGVAAVAALGATCLWSFNSWKQDVYVATKEIPAYHQIGQAVVKQTRLPRSKVPEKA